MVDIPEYATEEDVLDESGFTKEMIERITEMDDTEVTNLINRFLLRAESKVKELLNIPHIVPKELHLGDGETDEFDLGPEDEEFFIGEDVEDCVERVINCFFKRVRKQRPYPRVCDEYTDDKTKWDTNASYVQPTNENTIKKAGEYSMHFTFSSILKARYPDVSSDEYIDRSIDMYNFMFFRIRSDTNDVDLTVRLYPADATTWNEATYTIAKKGKWYLVMLHLDDDFTSDVDWNDDNLYHFEIEVDKACEIYLDNLCFCDDWAFTAPSGKLVIMRKSTDECAYPYGYDFYVTYTYDPFKVEVPECIKSATAQLAAVKLVDHLIGIREGMTAFELEGETMIAIPDKETLYARKGSLLARARENLAAYGYGWESTVAK